MRKIINFLIKCFSIKKEYRYSFSRILSSSSTLVNEPIIEFIETEYNGKKSIEYKSLTDVIYDHNIWKNFNDKDKNKILSYAFELRNSLNLNRYSIKKIFYNQNNSVTVQFNDKLVKADRFISIDILNLVTNNPQQILSNISISDMKQIFYYFNQIENNKFNQLFKEEKRKNLLGQANKIINFKDKIDEKNKRYS